MDPAKLEIAKLAMEEFRALHTEILQRNTTLMQIAAGGMGAIVAIIGFGASQNLKLWVTGLLILLVLSFIGATWFVVHGDTMKASDRLIEIEIFVNASVGGDDRNPLSWERRFGLRSRGYIDRAMGR